MEKEKRGWSIGRGCERDGEGGSVASFKRVGKGAHAVGGSGMALTHAPA
jgi:hypothetical protein